MFGSRRVKARIERRWRRRRVRMRRRFDGTSPRYRLDNLCQMIPSEVIWVAVYLQRYIQNLLYNDDTFLCLLIIERGPIDWALVYTADMRNP